MDQAQQGYKEYGTVSQPSVLMDSNVLLIQLENDNVLADIEHHLRGEVFDSKKGEWILRHGAEPLINELGIHTLMSIARSHIDKNIHLSKFTEQQIYKVMKDLEIDIIWNIRNNWDRFGIRKANVDFIIDIVTNPIFAAFKRAEDGITLDMLRNTQRIQNTMVADQKKHGLFGFNIFGNSS